MKVVIDASDVAEQLAECEVGEEKAITITVTKKGEGTIEGEATAVEHVTGGEKYEDEETPAEMPHGKAGRKVPKAILLVAANKA